MCGHVRMCRYLLKGNCNNNLGMCALGMQIETLSLSKPTITKIKSYFAPFLNSVLPKLKNTKKRLFVPNPLHVTLFPIRENGKGCQFGTHSRGIGLNLSYHMSNQIGLSWLWTKSIALTIVRCFILFFLSFLAVSSLVREFGALFTNGICTLSSRI